MSKASDAICSHYRFLAQIWQYGVFGSTKNCIEFLVIRVYRWLSGKFFLFFFFYFSFSLWYFVRTMIY